MNPFPFPTLARRWPPPCCGAAAILLLLPACTPTDFKQLAAGSDGALLLRQSGQGHSVEWRPAAQETPPPRQAAPLDAKRLPTSPSNSLAVPSGVTLQSALQLPPPSTLDEAQAALAQYLAVAEAQPEAVEKLLDKAERLAQTYPDDPLSQSLLQQLSRYSEWQPLSSIVSAAGLSFVAITGWQPESPFVRTRKALLPPVADNEQVIFADQRLVLLTYNAGAMSLHIDLRLEDIPFLPETPSEVLYLLDDLPAQHLLLVDQDDWQRVTLQIPAGEHELRIFQRQPVGNQYVKLRFDDHLSDLTVAQERPYFVSTAAMPLQFYCQGPARLRIDEWHDGDISYRYQDLAAGWQTLTLPPTGGKAQSLLRVNQRAVVLQPKPVHNRLVRRDIVPVPAAMAELKPPQADDAPVQLHDFFKLGEQEDGTFSPSVDLVRRNNKQESGVDLPEEQFAQYRVNYRYFDEPHDVYWNSQGLVRIREYGGPTFGASESVYYTPQWLPFTLRSEAKIFAQVPHDQMEWLAQWNLSAAKAYDLTPKLRLIPSLAFFARTLSLRNSSLARNDPIFKLKVDQDVFTPYKADHTAGLAPALTLEYRPWLDTVWSSKFSAGSNENLDFTSPDHYRSESHWKQLLGNVVLDASYQTTFYQADADRSTAETRSYAGLEMNWQQWATHQHRIELSGQYLYDLQRDAHLAMLSLTLHFGEGRAYRDFAPGEIDFRDLRQRQTLMDENNALSEPSH